jgi:hypothetical protein
MVFATKSPSRWCLEFLLIKGWVRLRLWRRSMVFVRVRLTTTGRMRKTLAHPMS